jgi:argininosuccinate lyase
LTIMKKKPWAGRFKEKTARSVEEFTESISFDRRLWRHDIAGSIAHARMLGKQKIISKADAGKIISGLKRIATEIEEGKFTFDPSLEDIHMNIEAALAKKIGAAGGRLHTARSRNDQVALDLRLYLRDETVEVAALLLKLQKALVAQAERNFGAVLPGYTHLQRAQPVLLSHHLLAYVEMLERDARRFVDTLKRINVLPLGSGALAGTSLPIDRKAVAKELGFLSVGQNSIDGVSDRDFALEFIFNASMVMMHLGRMSEELVLWASEEFSFIKLPDAFATGSSIMPQKKNPDVPELVRGKVGRVYGSLTALLTIMKGLPLAYNRDLQEDKPPVFDTVDTVKGSLGVMAEMMARLEFNAPAMHAAVSQGFAAATDLAEYLVRKGLPFRQAHEAVGKLVAYCISKQKGLDDLTAAELKKFSDRFDPDALMTVTPEASAATRASEGGTAPREVKKQLARWKKRLGL